MIKFEPASKERLEQYEEAFANKLYKAIESAVKIYQKPGTFDIHGVVDRHIPRIVELLNSNPSVDNLFCDGCNIGNHGIKLLAQGLKYVKKLSLDSTDIGFENPDTTNETVIALAKSNIKTLIISRTILTNDHIDLLIAHSRQTKIILGDNKYVDESRRDKANQKASDNSAKLLEMTFLGHSPSKRQKPESESGQTSSLESPEDKSLRKSK